MLPKSPCDYVNMLTHGDMWHEVKGSERTSVSVSHPAVWQLRALNTTT